MGRVFEGVQALLRFSSRHDASDVVFLLAVLFFEAASSTLIIQKVAYTEIDWQAYMDQVTTFESGERDYMQIRGDTGPLVYPAGFLYLFSFIRWLTNNGTVAQAQYVFLFLYLSTVAMVGGIVTTRIRTLRSRGENEWTLWSWRTALFLPCCSKRLHSIFLLRLFNDGPTMLLLYIAVYCMADHRWNIGCIIYSLAVSVKMNVLLFAPGILWVLLRLHGLKPTVIRLLSCCALPQLILGAPFLLTYPVHYLRKAFELDRVFFFKWTVNWKFLPEVIFSSKPFSILLLLLHLSVLAFVAVRWTRQASSVLSGHAIVYTLFLSNFVGIVFSRTLHYQFYVWYAASLPYLLWSHSKTVPLWLRVCLLGCTELCFLVFPATPTSSCFLQAAHLMMLWLVKDPPDDLWVKEKQT